MSLKSSIRETEHGIALRHGRLGAALHRGDRLHGARLQSLLETANSSLELLLALSSRARSAAATP